MNVTEYYQHRKGEGKGLKDILWSTEKPEYSPMGRTEQYSYNEHTHLGRHRFSIYFSIMETKTNHTQYTIFSATLVS